MLAQFTYVPNFSNPGISLQPLNVNIFLIILITKEL